MFYSIHIPKTAGTSFRVHLEEHYRDAIAFDYGSNKKASHPSLTGHHRHDRDTVAILANQGIRIIHGHFRARKYLPLAAGSQDFWVWVRDPVERVISHYSFFQDHYLQRNPFGRRVHAGEISLDEFITTKTMQNLQSRYIRPLRLPDLGFLGVAEHYDLSLLVGGFSQKLRRHERHNVTKKKAVASDDQVERIKMANKKDMELYREALNLLRERAELHGIRPPDDVAMSLETLG